MDFDEVTIRYVVRLALFVLCICSLCLSCSSLMKSFGIGHYKNNGFGSCCPKVHGNKHLIQLKNRTDLNSDVRNNIPDDKLFYGQNDNLINGLIPIFDKNSDHILVKCGEKCYYLLFRPETGYLYKSAEPHCNYPFWDARCVWNNNTNDEYKFTDYTQICSC